MVKVLLNNTVLAESDSPVVVEGSYYFPPGSVKKDYLSDSSTSQVPLSPIPWPVSTLPGPSVRGKGIVYDRGTWPISLTGPIINSTASYYSADVDGKAVKDIAWYYRNPKEKATHIKDHVAFYKTKVVIQE